MTPDARRSPETSARVSPDGPDDSRTPALLMAEPDEELAEAAMARFSAAGVSVIACHDGAEALLQVGAQHPAAVLLGAPLPVVNAADVTRLINQLSPVPVIVGAGRDGSSAGSRTGPPRLPAQGRHLTRADAPMVLALAPTPVKTAILPPAQLRAVLRRGGRTRVFGAATTTTSWVSGMGNSSAGPSGGRSPMTAPSGGRTSHHRQTPMSEGVDMGENEREVNSEWQQPQVPWGRLTDP